MNCEIFHKPHMAYWALLFCAIAAVAPAMTSHEGYFPNGYVDARSCIVCHKQAANEVIDSVHYAWRTENDTVEYPGGGAHGMIDRACGLVGSNSIVNYYDQCGRCHVGEGLPFPDPTTGEYSFEQKISIDCLICHAVTYDADNNGEADEIELADKRPLVYDDEKGKWVWHRDESTQAAESVGGPVSPEACLRCHHHGQADYEYKRGTPYEPHTDVHAAAGMNCTACHEVDAHKMARGSRVTDMFAWERQDVDVTCEKCHTDAPHKTQVMLNLHTDKIACETCHIPEVSGAARRVWAPTYGVTEGPEANVPVYNAETGQWEPYSEYDGELKPPSYRWYNGQASMLAEPVANAGNWDMQPATRDSSGAKITPFRNFISGQPMDGMGLPGTPDFNPNFTMLAALNQMAPALKMFGLMRPEGLTPQEEAMMGQFPNMLIMDRADYFANGDVTASVHIGMAKMGLFFQGQSPAGMTRDQLIAIGSQMWSGVYAGLDLPDSPFAPNYVPDMDPTTVTGSFITVSHAIKKDGALTCASCHTEDDGRLDFEALGYDQEMQTILKTMLTNPDHKFLIGDTYTGPAQCEVCHPQAGGEVMDSVHYLWRSENDTIEYPGGGAHGMIDRACGLVGSNSIVNYYQQCGRCHVGDGLPFPDPSTGEYTQEQKDTLDCLICHATEYDADNNGVAEELELADQRPLVYDDELGRMVWHRDDTLEAAWSVGGPVTPEACLRCHHHGQADYTYKRGTPYEPHTDVHAAAGMHCTECHVVDDHKIARGSRVTDMMGWDLQDVEVSCENCHTDAPHESDPRLNLHTDKIACETCHIPETSGAARRVWAPTYGVADGPEANIPVYNAETGQYEPHSEYDPELQSPKYRWYAGEASMLAEPVANAGNWDMQPATRDTPDAKIMAFRNFVSGQPMDALGLPGTPSFDPNFTMLAALNQMAPALKMFGMMRPEGLNPQEEAMMGQFPNMLMMDRADYFANGDVTASIHIGMAKMGLFFMGQSPEGMTREQLIGIGSQMWSGSYAGLDLPDNPFAPGYVADMDPTTVTGSFITLSHAIKKDGALSCADCHTEENGRLDFEALGYSPEMQNILKKMLIEPDHDFLIGDSYEGPQQCERCHPGAMEEMQGSVHYKFESSIPEGHVRDHDGNPVAYDTSGKLWKLCGFPTTVPQFNWLGALKDLPETPEVDAPGGCAQCHVGIGAKPYTAVGKTEPQASEANNMDCLICHAENYQRKFYVSTVGGAPEVGPSGPIVLAVPRADGVIDWASQTEAAKSVGKTQYETCLRCHAAAGGGTYQADEFNYASFKRGSIYGHGADVHADAGLSCSDCHSDGGHRMIRPVNNDLTAHDAVYEGEMCLKCHDAEPHDIAAYNMHMDKMSCTTCHATAVGSATYKDFSQHIAPDPSDPLGLWKVKMEFAEGQPAIDYKWFNGTVGPEITPLGERGDGKIHPYKHIAFNQPLDANGQPIPIKWGIFFKTGNMAGALATGLQLYTDMWTPEMQAKYGLAAPPGPFDHYGEIDCGGFSVSHGITKTEALGCADCHSPDGKMDFDALGYTPIEAEDLANLFNGGPGHASLFETYEGPQTCEQCHEGKIAEVQASVHYKFESELPEGYQFDHDGNPVTFTKSGKMWKLCGFPTTLPQFNWLGNLRDLPETPQIDNPGGCGKCHIGIGLKPYTANGGTEVQASEADNVDCLLCHAADYKRKFYTATIDGSPELTGAGTPLILGVPKVDGVIQWDTLTEVAQTVSKTKYDYCLRCHAAAGGGTFQADEYNYASFKRGSIYGHGADVHADAGLSCSDCHYAGEHEMIRPVNNDLSAHGAVYDGEMCAECHTETPHENDAYNQHVDKIACTTCHATATGSATYKDFSDHVPPDPGDPLALWGVKIEFAEGTPPIDYKWFNGTVGPEITPLGARDDGRIYPFKHIEFNQPLDANGHPVPIKWGIFFKTGNMDGALATGRSSYDAMWTQELQDTYGLAPVSGEFDHYGVNECGGFSVSHGITKDNALSCTTCHSTESPIDYAALGYSPEMVTHLQTMFDNQGELWMIY
ncbi:hypothetical protein KQI84_16320 [bacterium]|nr:hypothetical protein [bacterium]